MSLLSPLVWVQVRMKYSLKKEEKSFGSPNWAEGGGGVRANKSSFFIRPPLVYPLENRIEDIYKSVIHLISGKTFLQCTLIQWRLSIYPWVSIFMKSPVYKDIVLSYRETDCNTLTRMISWLWINIKKITTKYLYAVWSSHDAKKYFCKKSIRYKNKNKCVWLIQLQTKGCINKRDEKIIEIFFCAKSTKINIVVIYILQLGQLYSAYTLKKDLAFIFFNLPSLQKPGRNHFSENSYWVIKDLVILD